MKKVLLYLCAFSVVVTASTHFHDSDMDGVPDKKDRCHHTPFSALVDSRGCTVKTLATLATSQIK